MNDDPNTPEDVVAEEAPVVSEDEAAALFNEEVDQADDIVDAGNVPIEKERTWGGEGDEETEE